MRRERTIEVPINDGMLTDLLVSHYLRTFANFKLEDNEEVITLKLSEPDKDGMRKITFMFIEDREPQIIVHK
jgi:hypothetical protein